MKMTLQKGLKTDASTLVVFAAKDKKSGKPVTAKLDAGLQGLVAVANADGSFNGDKKETVFFRNCNVAGFKNVLLAGLGSAVDGEAVRVAAGAIYGSLKGHKVSSAAVLGESLLKFFRDGAMARQAFKP